jgi:hypothetical protein
VAVRAVEQQRAAAELERLDLDLLVVFLPPL